MWSYPKSTFIRPCPEGCRSHAGKSEGLRTGNVPFCVYIDLSVGFKPQIRLPNSSEFGFLHDRNFDRLQLTRAVVLAFSLKMWQDLTHENFQCPFDCTVLVPLFFDPFRPRPWSLLLSLWADQFASCCLCFYRQYAVHHFVRYSRTPAYASLCHEFAFCKKLSTPTVFVVLCELLMSSDCVLSSKNQTCCQFSKTRYAVVPIYAQCYPFDLASYDKIARLLNCIFFTSFDPVSCLNFELLVRNNRALSNNRWLSNLQVMLTFVIPAVARHTCSLGRGGWAGSEARKKCHFRENFSKWTEAEVLTRKNRSVAKWSWKNFGLSKNVQVKHKSEVSKNHLDRVRKEHLGNESLQWNWNFEHTSYYIINNRFWSLMRFPAHVWFTVLIKTSSLPRFLRNRNLPAYARAPEEIICMCLCFFWKLHIVTPRSTPYVLPCERFRKAIPHSRIETRF